MTHPYPKVVPNVAKCLNSFLFLGVMLVVGGYAEMIHPNPNSKSCSKCCKVPKSNILFLSATFMVVEYAEMTHP